MLTTRSAESGNRWDDEGADWARGGGIFGKAGGVTWAREAEVKHGRVCMLAAFGAIVQDLYTFPFMDKWYSGEKMWGPPRGLCQVWRPLAGMLNRRRSRSALSWRRTLDMACAHSVSAALQARV